VTAAGRYALRVRSDGGHEVVHPVEVVAGKMTEVSIVVPQSPRQRSACTAQAKKRTAGAPPT